MMLVETLLIKVPSNIMLNKIFLLCALCISVAFGVAYQVQASDVTAIDEQGGDVGKVFVPHKALYDIRLAGTKSGAQVVNIRGQMLYEWQTTCDAWSANHRFNLIYEYADSQALQVTSDFSTFEMFDGSSYDFNSQRKRDGDLFEELRGQVSTEDSGSVNDAVYTKPKGLVFDLPEGTLFPMAHTIEVLKHMRSGKKFYNATIFDGSDDKGPVEVTTFIGKEVNALANMEPSANIDTSLLNTPARKVRLAFFPLSDASSTADYEMTMVLHENGVVSDMFIEYDDFSVTQKLVALESVETLCDTDGAVTPIQQLR